LDGQLDLASREGEDPRCRRFDPGGSLDRRVNCRRVPQPRWVGARRSAKGGKPERSARDRRKRGNKRKLSPRAPAQMGRRETGVKGETRGLRVCPRPGRVRLQ
jgi:hypothetical protein